jgi:hypothetical protein
MTTNHNRAPNIKVWNNTVVFIPLKHPEGDDLRST